VARLAPWKCLSSAVGVRLTFFSHFYAAKLKDFFLLCTDGCLVCVCVGVFKLVQRLVFCAFPCRSSRSPLSLS
jgi:hypothetical protein